MKISMRHTLFATLIFGLTSADATYAAGPYPSKPIRIIVASGAGALLDATTRAVAQKMSENLGQPIVIENNASAGGLLAARQVKAAPADGYTLLAASNTLALNVALRKDAGLTIKDFAPIGPMSQAPLIMVGASSLPDKRLPDLIARSKAHPGMLSYASGGIATPTHLAAALFISQAGLNMVHVPYKGAAGAQSDLLSGRVSFLFDGANTAGPHIQEGRLRAYGVSSPKRSAAFPDIPTLAEQGFPDYSFLAYTGLAAPAGTPKEIVRQLAQALHAAVDSDVLRQRYRSEGSEAMKLSPEEFAAFLQRDAQRAAKLIEETGISSE